jgi:hypothetical protein
VLVSAPKLTELPRVRLVLDRLDRGVTAGGDYLMYPRLTAEGLMFRAVTGAPHLTDAGRAALRGDS